jgi:hypothetical protein
MEPSGSAECSVRLHSAEPYLSDATHTPYRGALFVAPYVTALKRENQCRRAMPSRFQ